MLGCLPLGSKFPVIFNWEWRFSTAFLSLYLHSLMSLRPQKRTKRNTSLICLCGLPSSSKFPVNFNWEWRFSTEFLSLYCHSLLSLDPDIHKKQCLSNISGCLHSGSKFHVNFNWDWRFSTELYKNFFSFFY